jgi:hypothetical protein
VVQGLFEPAMELSEVLRPVRLGCSLQRDCLSDFSETAGHPGAIVLLPAPRGREIRLPELDALVDFKPALRDLATEASEELKLRRQPARLGLSQSGDEGAVQDAEEVQEVPSLRLRKVDADVERTADGEGLALLEGQAREAGAQCRRSSASRGAGRRSRKQRHEAAATCRAVWAVHQPQDLAAVAQCAGGSFAAGLVIAAILVIAAAVALQAAAAALRFTFALFRPALLAVTVLAPLVLLAGWLCHRYKPQVDEVLRFLQEAAGK